ncbi:hypothetical protein CRYUN_Cryun13aG0138100 [Craigia yunnanensis]
MDQIHHFLHIHPLLLTEKEEVNDEVLCSGCREGLADPIYGCSKCKFYLHKSCAQLPQEIQNFFHPCTLVLNILSYENEYRYKYGHEYGCNACFKYVYGFSYRCKKCGFDMHVKCALRPTIKSEGEELIHHFTHWHPLTLVDQKKYLEVRCGICEKLCYGSSNSSAYGCEECNFFIHNSCMMNIPRQINHIFHPSCPLILLKPPSHQKKCSSCDEVGSDLVFRCGKCYFQLDVKCALLPTVESKGADKIQHSAHQHPLALRENMDLGSEVRCRACGENCFDPCFVCERCNFFLHRQCAVELQIQHHFHPLHPLVLSPLPPNLDHDTIKCPACGGMFDRFMLVYRCAKCDFNLHTDCAKPKLTPFLKYGGHSHFLNFVDKTRAPFLCRICSDKAQSCFFRCVACQFNIHLYCLPSAPKTIKHRCHLHPLTLTRSPLEFELNSPEEKYNSNDEFYCDVCEEKRYKFESVYYCEECKFIAEIRCVMSELLPSLTISKDQSTMNGRVISRDEENSALEATIAELKNTITELREEEKPLEVEIEKLQSRLETIKWKLKTFETDHFLYIYQLNHNNENNYANEASTSEGGWLPICL